MAATTGDDPDPLDQELGDLVRAAEHVRWVQERRRRHELRRQADEATTLVGALGSLVGTGRMVIVSTRDGTHPPSAIVELGRDYLALRSGDQVRLVPLVAVAAIRALATADALPVASGAPPLRLDLAERLAELAALRQQVRVEAGTAPSTVEGRLRQASCEILLVQGDDGLDALIPIGAVTAVGLSPCLHSSASPPLSAEPTTSG
jgi:hypothetical protein